MEGVDDRGSVGYEYLAGCNSLFFPILGGGRGFLVWSGLVLSGLGWDVTITLFI